MLDRAYECAKEEFRHAYQAASSRVEAEFPHSSYDDVYSAVQKAMCLTSSANELAFKVHGSILTWEGAISILKRGNPGFSDETYEKAFSTAYIDAR